MQMRIFLENIKSLKSNNSTSNFYKRPINSCNNTINSNKVNKIINNNANRNLRLKTYNNNRVIDSNFINKLEIFCITLAKKKFTFPKNPTSSGISKESSTIFSSSINFITFDSSN